MMSYWVEGCRCTIDPDGDLHLNGCPPHGQMVQALWPDPCPLCGSGAPHDEAACDEKMKAWKPSGILATIDSWPSDADPPWQEPAR